MAHEKDESSSSRKAGKSASNEFRERRRSRSPSRSRSPPRHRRDVRGGGSKWNDDDDDERYRKRRDGRGGRRNGDDAEEEEEKYPRRDRGDVDSRSGKRRDDGGERNGHRSSSRREEYRDRSRSRSPARWRRRQGNDESEDERRPKGRDRSASVAAGNNNALVRGSPSSRALERERKSSKDAETPDLEAEEASKPNFAPSGKLAAETNMFKGVVLKYHEPPEGRKPVASGKNGGWRLYVFKGKEELETLHIHRQSAYLIGRERVVADIPIEHPSTSKQHAVIQYRTVSEKNEFGDTKSSVKPYIIDLESANGTYVNNEKIPASRYFELMSGDVIKFGFSTREYVFLAEDPS